MSRLPDLPYLSTLPRHAAGQILPPLEQTALLLDLDGTLLDIAPTPTSVVVPDGLAASLLMWRSRLGGALAIVTGRPIDQIDELLPDIPTAIAGEHGGAIRHRPDGPIERPYLPTPPQAWYDQAAALVQAHPGAVLEAKLHGFAVHYRAAPIHGPALGEGLAALIATRAVEFSLLPALMAWEVVAIGADKGTAVQKIMDRPPFAGRLPLFIGDDVTDEHGMAAARRLGGVGLRVPEIFGDAAGVRKWLG